MAVALFSAGIFWSSFVAAQDAAVAMRGHVLATHSAVAQSASPATFGGTDVNLITGAEVSPNVTQDESAIWGHQNTVVVVYTDSSGSNLTPRSFCGVSVSTDSGSTFTRLPYKFNVDGGCDGAASVIYSVRAHKWIASFLADRCAAFVSPGVGTWTSVNGIDWVNGPCAFVGHAVRPSLWVDNNPASPFFGRLYAAFNDWDDGASPHVAISTNDGSTWNPSATINSGFRRVQKITGSPGADGTVFIQTLDEGGGGLLSTRENWIYRSTDGAATFGPQISQGTFYPPGRSEEAYFVGMYSTPIAGYWTEMGWGEPAVGPNGVVHFAYTGRGAGSDPGSIYYLRSTDNGVSWSAPLQLNTDATSRAQWGVSLSANAQGLVFVSWYDERNTSTDALERFGRASLDNGATWGPDLPLSDVVFPKPLQPDGTVRGTFVGEYNHTTFSNDGNGGYAYHAWTDGRVSIAGSPQQDVFFDKIMPFPAFVVTTTDDHDDGVCDAADCTLREAILAANARSGDDRIEFAAAVTGIIQLGSALPPIVGNIELVGPGANVLSVQRAASAGSMRIFEVTSGSTFSSISGLTIANGNYGGSGGGIANGGTLLLANMTLVDNHAMDGAGIFNDFGTLTITGSTISGNSVSNAIFAGSGGGIFNEGGILTVSNSTISGNSAVGPGGTSDSGGGIITNVGSVVLANSTIAFNLGDLGGGIRNVNGGTVLARNTIIAKNTSASGPDVNGPLISAGFNLIGNDGGANASITPADGDQIGTAQSPVDPLLDSLQDNGGATFTHALRSGSPAIDRGRSSGVAVDQRGLLRTADLPYVTNAPGGDGSDIGSFEFQSDVIFRDGFEP